MLEYVLYNQGRIPKVLDNNCYAVAPKRTAIQEQMPNVESFQRSDSGSNQDPVMQIAVLPNSDWEVCVDGTAISES